MKPSIQVVTPAHLLDPALAIAAARAGEIGLLDLGLGASRGERRGAIDRLARLAGTDTRWGVRWDVLGRSDRLPSVLGDLREEPFPWLLVAGVPPDGMASALEQARQVATRVLIETCEIPEAVAAAGAGCDGVVLKANEAGGRVSRASSFLLLQRLREVAVP